MYLRKLAVSDGDDIYEMLQEIPADENGKGYGSKIAELLAAEARKMGVDEILITVHADNEASLKAALNAGGKIIKTENGRYCVGL